MGFASGFAQFLRRVLPKENQYFELFTANVGNIQLASTNFRLLLDAATAADRKVLITKIQEAERRGDEITHEIFTDVSQTFISPIDREDIHAIATHLDDILDLLEDTALRTELYEITFFPDDFRVLADTFCVAVKSLAQAVPLLSHMKHRDEIERLCDEISVCENTGDDIYHSAVARLFREQTDPIELIKLKEILSEIEAALNKCEAIAHAIEGVIIKYA